MRLREVRLSPTATLKRSSKLAQDCGDIKGKVTCFSEVKILGESGGACFSYCMQGLLEKRRRLRGVLLPGKL